MGDQSQFYKQKASASTATTPVTYLLLEALQNVLGEQSSGVLGDILSTTLCRIHHAPLEKKALENLALDLSALYERNAKLEKEHDGKPASGSRATLGSGLNSWLQGLDPVRMCYLLAGFDPDKAERLYCEVDHRIVIEMASVYTANRQQEVQVLYETSMYGFGGKYKGDKGGNSADNTVDLTSENGEGLALLGELGF